jgi:hypothetical protein
MTWRKSSFSGSATDCVEVAWPATGVAVRDSKNATGPMLLLSEGARAALIETLKP